MNTNNFLIRTIEAGIATATLNRPEARNALAPEMLRDLSEFLMQVERDSAVRCLVIRAAGPNFIAGGDVGSFMPTLSQAPQQRAATFETRVGASLPLYECLERMPKPVVVVARGAIAGAGIAFALAADLTIISDTAFFFFAHGQLGLSLDGGVSYYLPRAVGQRKARELALMNARVGAAEALQMGLASRLVADADLDSEADKYIQKLAAGATVSMAQTKRLVEQSFRNDISAQFREEVLSCGRCAATQDFAEGVTAFMEKRKPQFSGN